jgi:acyl-CoA synthetase (AMP-forming)/AMP-acid ligase II
MYGQTEATARMGCLPSDAFAAKKGSAGRAIAGGSFTIEDGGEVVYRGPNVMMGYADGPDDLTKGDELGGVLRTGDLGTLDADGFLTITGRTKRIVKVYGNRYNLDEVEALARAEYPVAALGREERVIVFCEGASLEGLARVRRLVAGALGVHGDAVDARSIDAIPTTQNGKTDYPSLDALAGT